MLGGLGQDTQETQELGTQGLGDAREGESQDHTPGQGTLVQQGGRGYSQCQRHTPIGGGRLQQDQVGDAEQLQQTRDDALALHATHAQSGAKTGEIKKERQGRGSRPPAAGATNRAEKWE